MKKTNLSNLFKKQPFWVNNTDVITRCFVDFLVRDKDGITQSRRSNLVDDTITKEEGDDLMVPSKATILTTWITGRIEITVDFGNETISCFRSHQGDRGRISEIHWVLSNVNDGDEHPVVFLEKAPNGIVYDVDSCLVSEHYETKDLINYIKTTLLDPIDQIFENNPGEDLLGYVTEDKEHW